MRRRRVSPVSTTSSSIRLRVTRDGAPTAASAFPATAFFAASWLVLGAAGSSRMFQDSGVFWHLLTGARILSRGLPHEDWLTFTHAGKPWIAHQWLAELGMTLLHRAGGYDALLVGASGLVAALFTWLLQRLVSRGVQVRWAILLTALALMVSAGSLHMRPLLLSMAFFACTYVGLVDVESGRLGVRGLGWLVPLFVVWANCHGAVLGGICSLWLAAVFWLALWLLGRGQAPVRSRTDVVAVALVALGAGLAPLANPYGLELLRTWSTILRSRAVAELIVEHGSLWRTGSWYVLPLAIAYLAVWVGAGRDRWRASSLLTLVWLVLMTQRVRHAPLFAIAALISLAELLPHCAVASWLAIRGARTSSDPPTIRPIRPLLMGAPVLALTFACIGFQITGRSLSGPRRGPWPFELKPAIEAAVASTGPGAPILNDMVLGGFLAQQVPQARIFGDDRCELYEEDFLRAWIGGSSEWFAGWVARFDVQIAVAQRGSALESYLRAAPAWGEVASTRAFALFRRAAGAPPSRRTAHRNHGNRSCDGAPRGKGVNDTPGPAYTLKLESS